MNEKITRQTAQKLYLNDRYTLTKGDCDKQVFHISLKGEGIQYEPGDSLAIFPSHDPELVEKTLVALKLEPTTLVKEPRTEQVMPLKECLSHWCCIRRISPTLAEKIAPNQIPEDPSLKKEFLASFEVWDFCQSYSPALGAQEFVDTLFPILPRFYSIASAKSQVKDEVHLTVATADFETRGQLRRGIGSHFLGRLASIHTTPIFGYVHPSSHFHLPTDLATPMIMVGPGTGVAPFRGFMQERMQHPSARRNWLFFGEKHRHSHFFYEDFWQQLVDHNLLNLTCAFSRDSAEKVYVQHKLLEHSAEVWQWLQEGAIFYVCGDANEMAKAVEQALQTIAAKEGSMDLIQTRQWIKEMRQSGRYRRDVY